MTATSDSAPGENALAKKVKCASFDISGYPRLVGIVSFLKKHSALALSACVKANTPPAEAKVSMQEAQAALDDAVNGAVYYWFCDRYDEHAALVGCSPVFVAALSEALLGNEFTPAHGEVSPTGLDSELVQLFATELVDEVNKYLVEQSSDARAGDLKYSRMCGSRENTLKDLQTSAFFCIRLDFQFGQGKLDSALNFYLPLEFSERKGLLAQLSKTAGTNGESTQWYADMLSNIHRTEIDLPVVIGRYKMTLSDLSKLKVDQIIPLEEDAHNALDITLKSHYGSMTLCKGRLGAYKKSKAVKVTSEITAG